MNDVWKAPGMLGYMQVLVGEVTAGQGDKGTGGQGAKAGKYYAGSVGAPIQTASAWPVVVVVPEGVKSATLSWDASVLPDGYEGYVFGGPSGPVNMRKVSSVALSPGHLVPSSISLSVVVGLPEYLGAYLASPLSKEESFAYPNPGPDASGDVVFKYNLDKAATVTLKIFDVGGKLVKELSENGKLGSNTTLKWDGTNKHGQKVGSGVYIYIMEGAGTKLIDKLAIIR
jgi:hypothetical protein